MALKMEVDFNEYFRQTNQTASWQRGKIDIWMEKEVYCLTALLFNFGSLMKDVL